jgi:hypothetical protein
MEVSAKLVWGIGALFAFWFARREPKNGGNRILANNKQQTTQLSRLGKRGRKRRKNLGRGKRQKGRGKRERKRNRNQHARRRRRWCFPSTQASNFQSLTSLQIPETPSATMLLFLGVL